MWDQEYSQLCVNHSSILLVIWSIVERWASIPNLVVWPYSWVLYLFSSYGLDHHYCLWPKSHSISTVGSLLSLLATISLHTAMKSTVLLWVSSKMTLLIAGLDHLTAWNMVEDAQQQLSDGPTQLSVNISIMNDKKLSLVDCRYNTRLQFIFWSQAARQGLVVFLAIVHAVQKW